MKHKSLLSTLIFIFSINLVSAQFIVKDGFFSPTGLANNGKIAGYESQGGPYSFWLPDSGNVIIDIGGIAPGNGVGGRVCFSTDGNLLCGTSQGTNGPEMSKYDRSTDQWTRVGSLGFSVGGNVSGGFAISGDGKTVVGLSWADTTGGHAYAHAVASSQLEGLMDLGSLFDSIYRSTRANAVNYDGSVVVGWQDFNGPWKSAVWRKNPAGGYFPNQYILIDTTANPNDEFNQMGECSAVSDNGEWIGGFGDYANNNEPWIWSQDSGVINLGAFANVGNGYVSSMSGDGSIVVGWFDGLNFGDPRTPFIWTRAGGLQELNGYINNVLGDSTGTHQIYTANCISPDGHFITGYGVDTSTFNSFVYRVALAGTTGIQNVAGTANMKIYPNPTSGLVTIEIADKNAGKTIITISNMEGRVVYKTELNETLVLDISTFAQGVYSISIQTSDSTQTQRLIKN